jgi:hypothetical protein
MSILLRATPIPITLLISSTCLPGELVRQFECVSDTKGDEAGLKSGVRAHFNPIKIEVETSEIAYKTIQVDPTPKFVPSHVGGDRDFGAHGPQVGVSATISVQNQTEIWMDARERDQVGLDRGAWIDEFHDLPT